MQMNQKPDAILIAGPTASGKSKFALDLARQWDGEIVNADSMQIYPVLDVLTARPEPEDLQLIPHHLYGYAPIDEAYSVARWLEDAKKVSAKLWACGKIPVFVGGTGLYFQALEEGLVHIPDIRASVRDAVRRQLQEEGSDALYEKLRVEDPLAAQRLRPSDGHRIARALEVVRSTGKSLIVLQEKPVATPLLHGKHILRYVLMPPRPLLHERINQRSCLMIEKGAVDEVQALLTMNITKDATVLKAIGVKQISAYLAQEEELLSVIEKIQAATRQYAKRQVTWFNGKFSNQWQRVNPCE